MFAIFIDDLAQEVKEKNLGIKIGEDRLALLMYADDIVILGENFEDTQTLLDVLSKNRRTWEWLYMKTEYHQLCRSSWSLVINKFLSS